MSQDFSRRSALAGLAALPGAAQAPAEAPIEPRDPLKVTRLETFLVKSRWLFLKIHASVKELAGLGEPILEGRALTCAAAVKEIEPYLAVGTRAPSPIAGRPSVATPSIAAARPSRAPSAPSAWLCAPRWRRAAMRRGGPSYNSFLSLIRKRAKAIESLT